MLSFAMSSKRCGSIGFPELECDCSSDQPRRRNGTSPRALGSLPKTTSSQVRTNDAFRHQLLDVFDALIAPTFEFLKREAERAIGLI